MRFRLQIVDLEPGEIGVQCAGSHDHVFELSDVAWPLAFPQGFQCGCRNLNVGTAMTPEKMSDQNRQVLDPPSKRGNLDRHHGETKVQIATKGAIFDPRLEILIGRCDHPGVDLAGRVLSDALDLTLLENSKKLGLERQRHVPDLVEKEGAAVGGLELALVVGARAGEGALPMPE